MIVPVTLRREVTHQMSQQAGGRARNAILLCLSNSIVYRRWEPGLGTQVHFHLLGGWDRRITGSRLGNMGGIGRPCLHRRIRDAGQCPVLT